MTVKLVKLELSLDRWPFRWTDGKADHLSGPTYQGPYRSGSTEGSEGPVGSDRSRPAHLGDRSLRTGRW